MPVVTWRKWQLFLSAQRQTKQKWCCSWTTCSFPPRNTRCTDRNHSVVFPSRILVIYLLERDLKRIPIFGGWYIHYKLRWLTILSSKVLTMMPSGKEVAKSAISFLTVLKNFFASGGWNSIFLKAWLSNRGRKHQDSRLFSLPTSYIEFDHS